MSLAAGAAASSSLAWARSAWRNWCSETYPQARVLRWDLDTTVAAKRRTNRSWIALSAGEADIMIGTQMIAKGWTCPR